MAPGKENIGPADFLKLGGDLLARETHSGFPQYRCRVCPQLSAQRWSFSRFQRHVVSSGHHKNLQLALARGDVLAPPMGLADASIAAAVAHTQSSILGERDVGLTTPLAIRATNNRTRPITTAAPRRFPGFTVVKGPISHRPSSGGASGDGGADSDFDFEVDFDWRDANQDWVGGPAPFSAPAVFSRMLVARVPVHIFGRPVKRTKSQGEIGRHSPYFPFPSTEMLIAALYLRSPSKRVSMADYEKTRSVVKALGFANMPAARTVGRFLDNLVKELPLFSPRQVETYKGHKIAVISPADMIRSVRPNPWPAGGRGQARLPRRTIALLLPLTEPWFSMDSGCFPFQHLATPELRELMEHIPYLPPSSINSAADTRAFWELSPNARTPMQRFAAFDVFINEIVELHGGQYAYVVSFAQDGAEVKTVVARAQISGGDDDLIHVKLPPLNTEPIKWDSKDRMEDGRAYLYKCPHDRSPNVACRSTPTTPTMPTSQSSCPTIRWSMITRYHLPSRCRGIANGGRWHTVPIRIFLDDLSGGVSKRQFPLHPEGSRQVPHRAVYRSRCIVRRCDEEVLFSMPLLYSVHDTPMAAEVTARATGGQAKFPCRFGKWGGTLQERLELLALRQLFSCPDRHSNLRTQIRSVQAIRILLDGLGQSKLDAHMRDTGTRDKVTLDVIKRLEQAYQAEQRYWVPDDAPPDRISAEARAYRAMAPSL
ncbi:BQ2448_919 [Microbotryum intermedium]|uniref:BQ2448_919 protein n=1 Tax=Microbotryum intermedium TaxID=269621 RepID=A0A238FCC6_9BASI|nr:BQ2448_919 [Microbotryum intermedium]